MARTLLDALIDLVPARTTKPPIPYASRAGLSGLFGGRRGQTAELEAMGSVSTLFAIVNRTAKAEAGVHWRLYRSAASGRPEDRTEVTSHAALDLWNRPNPFYTRSTFVEATQQHRQLTGEQWWVLERTPYSTIPTGIWPVRPDRMEPVPDREQFIAGYLYSGPDGEQVRLEREDVIFLRTPHPLDPYRGIGPVQSLLTDLDAARYSAEWNRQFFLNSAEPGGIIEVPSALSDPQFDKLRERWNEQHRGVANAHRVAILEHGKWIDRKYTQRDMEFTALRNVSREIIREAFGFPTPMLGTSENVNLANAQAGEVMFARWLVVPDLVAIRDALNTQLLPLFPTAKGMEFDFDNPVPDDAEALARELSDRAVAASTLRRAGWDSADVLSATGLPAMGAPDAREQLLVDIVRGAPSTAPMILPLLGFDVPGLPAPGGGAQDTARARWDAAYARLLDDGAGDDWSAPDIDNAQRWRAEARLDDNTCGPCRDNNGKLYRNRAAAWKDYPGGTGYVHCVGEEYGNQCRCKVVKRGRKGEGE